MTWPALVVGMRGPEIGNWQRFLNDLGYTDWNGKPLVTDEQFGMKTSYATRQWQTQSGLEATGEVGPKERQRSKQDLPSGSLGFIPFIQAKNATLLYPKVRNIDVLVIHTMESPEKPGTAEAVGRWFAGDQAPKASAHYGIDPENIVQYVRDGDVAWHAPGANNNGIGLEHAGRAAQSPSDWEDEDSTKILALSAKLAAKLVRRHGIPVRKLSAQDLKNGWRGICGHADVTQAFPGPGRNHWDPGPNFVWSLYLEIISFNLPSPA